jgi:hypothetical protein
MIAITTNNSTSVKPDLGEPAMRVLPKKGKKTNQHALTCAMYDRTGRTVKQILAGSAALPNGREWPIDRREPIERGE